MLADYLMFLKVRGRTKRLRLVEVLPLRYYDSSVVVDGSTNHHITSIIIMLGRKCIG